MKEIKEDESAECPVKKTECSEDCCYQDTAHSKTKYILTDAFE